MAGISASGLHVSGTSTYGTSQYANTDGLAGYEGCRTDVGRRYGMGTIRWVGESSALVSSRAMARLLAISGSISTDCL